MQETNSMTNDELRSFNEKFQFMRFLDYGRWHGEKNNYYSINMANKNAPGEDVLLTHFLGYITNRQTPFEMIFERLDYIFSQMVRDFSDGASVDQLLSPEHSIAENGSNMSYFVKKNSKAKNKKMNHEVEEDKDTDVYAFVSHRKTYNGKEYKSSDSVLEKTTESLFEENNGFFYAASRFYPTDYVAIYSVLHILEKRFEKKFFSFIKWAIGQDCSLERLLYALWVIGYKDVGQWKAEDIKFGITNLKEYKELLRAKETALDDLDINGLNSSQYMDNFSRDRKTSFRFKSKRVFCYVRDLLKYKSCADLFRRGIGESVFLELSSQIPAYLELPGDVWNNNKTFQKCLDISNERLGGKKDTPNIRVRNIYEQLCKAFGEDNVGCYPEQFDCTFDFVRRMCNAIGQTNCIFCPLYQDNHFLIPKELCYCNEDGFCPFLLFAVGYKVKCIKMKDVCPNWKIR